MGAELRVDIQRQASNTELPRTAQATLEVVNQLLTAIQGDNLMPVLVFDDTDRWFRKAGGTMDHHDLALTFFGTVLPELRQLPTSIVIAAHNDYLNNTDLANHLRATIESRINIPELPSTEALGKSDPLTSHRPHISRRPHTPQHHSTKSSIPQHSTTSTSYTTTRSQEPPRRHPNRSRSRHRRMQQQIRNRHPELVDQAAAW